MQAAAPDKTEEWKLYAQNVLQILLSIEYRKFTSAATTFRKGGSR